MPADAARSWTHTHEESTFLRALAALPVAVVGTGVVAVTVLAVGVLVALFVGGRYALGAALLLALAVMSARVAPHRLARTGDGRSFVSRLREFRPRALAAALAVGAAVWAVGAALGRVGFVAVVAATVLFPLTLRAALSSEGEVDSEAGTLTYCGTDVDLATLDRVRRLAVGGYVVYRLSFVGGAATFGTPRWLVIPGRADPAVRAALDRGAAADPGGVHSSNRTVRLAAGALGLFFLAFAGFLLTVAPSTGHPRGEGALWYAAFVTGGFGALFVGIGLRGG